MAIQPNDIQQADLKVDSWFSSMVDQLKVDHFLLTTDTASPEKKEFYFNLIHDGSSIFKNMRDSSTQFYISGLVNDYVNELKVLNKLPVKLAMGLSDSKILVWSEINDDDEETENALLIAEAKVNGKYIQNGFFINSTIIEQSDNLPIPPHYQTLIA